MHVRRLPSGYQHELDERLHKLAAAQPDVGLRMRGTERDRGEETKERDREEETKARLKSLSDRVLSAPPLPAGRKFSKVGLFSLSLSLSLSLSGVFYCSSVGH